jgi:hypothetical protein
LERCFRMEGSFRVYLQEDSAINMESIRQQALASVERGFRDGLIYLGGGSTLAAHYLGPAEVPLAVVPNDPNTGTADSSIVADQGSQQQDTEPTTTTQGDEVDDAATTQGIQVDDTSETAAQGDQVDDAAETTTEGYQVGNASETAPSATTTEENEVDDTTAETTATTTQGNQLDDITAGITPITATTTQGKQVDDTNGSIANADTSPQDSQGQESGLEQQTSITNPSPDKNSSGGFFSVNVTIFLIVGGILGLVGAAYAGKNYYRRARLFGRGVDKNFDDDSLDGHEQYPAVKLDPSDTTMNTSSGYSANEPGTEDFLRDLEDFKTFDTPSKGSSSGSSINMSGDADMLSLSLMGMALMSHNATKIFD